MWDSRKTYCRVESNEMATACGWLLKSWNGIERKTNFQKPLGNSSIVLTGLIKRFYLI